MPGQYGEPIPEDYGFVGDGQGSYQLDPRYDSGSQYSEQQSSSPVSGLDPMSLLLGSYLGGDSQATTPGNVQASLPSALSTASDLGGLDVPSSLQLRGQDLFPGAAPSAGMEGASILPQAALALTAAYTGKKSLEGFQAGSEAGGPWSGFKAGLNSAGPLKYVPLLGQAPALAGLAGGVFGHESPRHKEQRRSQDLAGSDQSYADFYGKTESERPLQQQRMSQLGKDFSGIDPQTGLWVNNTKNRQVEDYWGAPDFFKQYPDWLSKSEQDRRNIVQDRINANAISEKHGGTYVDFNKAGSSINPSSPNRNLDNPKSTALAQQSGGVPNQYGNTRLSPGIYKDKNGNVFMSKDGR